MMFDTESDIEVIGEASNGVAMIDLCRRFSPTVAVLDIRMPIMDGIQAIPELLALPNLEKPRILVLTTFDDDDYVYRALRAGASGFLLKDAPPNRLWRGCGLWHAARHFWRPRSLAGSSPTSQRLTGHPPTSPPPGLS